MAWCAGGCSIWRSGSSRNSASRSPSRRSAGSCAPWATANSRPDRATMRKRRARLRILKSFPVRLEEIACAKALDCDTIEIWFADEARIGQKNKTTRRWAKRGTRPNAPRDQRTASTYIFGAVCPKRGKGAALILPACNTEAMNLHLAEIAAAVAPAAHAVLLVDQAGWHMSKRLVVPANITSIALPPKCPELNPVENVWQFMRDNWLSNRIFKSYDDLVDHCCEAWNKLVDQIDATTAADTIYRVSAFRDGLKEAGFIDGHNVAIEFRWAENKFDRLPALAADLVQRQVAVIVGPNIAMRVVRTATLTIPIVFVSGGDPIESGLVTNLSRPGGNITGVSYASVGLQTKRLALLHELVPPPATIAWLRDPRAPSFEGQEKELP